MLNNNCHFSYIFARSLLQGIVIDTPIGVTVVSIDNPEVTKIGAATLTFIASSICYFIRDISRECVLPYLHETHPYIGSIVGGTIYHSLIDGVNLQSAMEGSTRQLAYEINLNYHPFGTTILGTLASSIIIEIFQSEIEGHGISRGVIIGTYVGTVLSIIGQIIPPQLDVNSESIN